MSSEPATPIKCWSMTRYRQRARWAYARWKECARGNECARWTVSLRAALTLVSFGSFVSFVSFVAAQPLALLEAEDRRAPSANDLAAIRSGTRSDDPQTVRIAVRALGRLERPALAADILPFLKHSLPEIRAEAATALGQAGAGTKQDAASANSVIDALVSRSTVEGDGAVRGALFETLGRTAITAA